MVVSGIGPNVPDGPSTDRGPPHVPVMVAEVTEALEPLDGALVIDGTFGAGGYSAAFLDRGAHVIGIDRDPHAHAMARASGMADRPGLTLRRMDFARLDGAADGPVDAVALDIGVSSMQIDRAERGFSFMRDGPLDMRMGGEGPTAADVVNHAGVSDLTRIIGILGEERHAPRVARAIDAARHREPIQTTGRLASVVEGALGRKPGDRIHPATRTFQALRIHVNDELGQLARALAAAERALKAGGRLAVVTFHSLEDRMVKRFLADRAGGARGSRHMPAAEEREPTFEPIGKQGRQPSEDEMSANPRARSARLRAARRTGAPARGDVPALGHDLPPVTAHATHRQTTHHHATHYGAAR